MSKPAGFAVIMFSSRVTSLAVAKVCAFAWPRLLLPRVALTLVASGAAADVVLALPLVAPLRALHLPVFVAGQDVVEELDVVGDVRGARGGLGAGLRLRLVPALEVPAGRAVRWCYVDEGALHRRAVLSRRAASAPASPAAWRLPR
eukprot:CAMPEP_0179116178 /NCGR_PEP_ID=MMETSP0796-20121207/54477_1 /TAXON_ID=73915 /ORGANISM="Pyrodinium bahamense, Strain pbaha01" /LENGTH=145 /DNA_ID=CAMNT_0020814443 /DNA_START=358 /DNA_END=794 /DNA_ORIENTATION=-